MIDAVRLALPLGDAFEQIGFLAPVQVKVKLSTDRLDEVHQTVAIDIQNRGKDIAVSSGQVQGIAEGLARRNGCACSIEERSLFETKCAVGGIGNDVGAGGRGSLGAEQNH